MNISCKISLNMNEFSNWITRQFVEWQANVGKRKTLEEFAAYIGVSRPLLNMWMNGNKKPGRENIKLLAETFGLEIYDVLDMPRPDPDLERLSQIWDRIPEKARQSLREQGEKYIVENKDGHGKPAKKPA